MRQVFFALLFIMCFAALGVTQDITFQWEYDAEEAPKITGFHAWQTKNPGRYDDPFVGTFENTALTGVLPSPGYGKWCWVWTAFVAETAGDVESIQSNEVCQTLKPKPPKLISVAQSVLTAPIKAATMVASLFLPKKNLRIID